MANTMDLLGNKTIVDQADVLDLQSAVNRKGDTRVGGDAMGKRAGMEVLVRLTSGSTLTKAFALGPLSSDAFRTVDGSANFTPVNLLDSGGGAGYTESAGCTYAAGLLTADGVDDPTTTQDVVLKAGKYRLTGKATAEGTTGTHDAPLLTITGATDGEYMSTAYRASLHATAAESQAEADRESVDVNFEVLVDQTVTFELSNVSQADALQAGSSYIILDGLEAYNG